MTAEQPPKPLEDILSDADQPILVVFDAPWCGPSHLMDSTLEQVDARLGDRLQVVRIDSEANPEVASRYQAHALPTFILFKQGQPVKRIEKEHTEELIPADQLIDRLAPFM
ncbi:MAG: thioredoxin family protein [Elainellaceae cyanobacterium]